MLFIHTFEKVLDGSKVATSRIVKPGDMANALTTGEIFAVTAGSRLVYALGKDYAVQPGRGKKAVGRVRITGIDRYDVRTITGAQARAEGFRDKYQFLLLWCEMHDPAFHKNWLLLCGEDVAEYACPTIIRERPAALYDAWLLTFELVKGAQ